jgi:hypothetical protein
MWRTGSLAKVVALSVGRRGRWGRPLRVLPRIARVGVEYHHCYRSMNQLGTKNAPIRRRLDLDVTE